MFDISETTIVGGNFKNYLRLSYPCDNIEDIREPTMEPPTLRRLAWVIKRHRAECEQCE